MMNPHNWLGIDVGSMSVKLVLLDPSQSTVLHGAYRIHHGEQSNTLWSMLAELDDSIPIFGRSKVAMTGSGGTALADVLQVDFVQEVTSVAAAVEFDFPDACTAIDLGGQDAKMIIWNRDVVGRKARKFTTMNNKCAGGTGATLDRVVRKLGLEKDTLSSIHFDPEQVYPVATKCGIFAETDINSLLKQGILPQACLVSLCDAIVRQNLGSLARGKTVLPPVILLGGPNMFFQALVEAWEYRLKEIWRLEGAPAYSTTPLVHRPSNGLLVAARGAAIALRSRVIGQRESMLGAADSCKNTLNRANVSNAGMRAPAYPSSPASFIRSCKNGRNQDFWRVTADSSTYVMGLDAGSTSTKGVILDSFGRLIARSYQLTSGQPIEGAKRVLHDLGRQLWAGTGTKEVTHLTITGYAREHLKEVLGADQTIVETVAHVFGAREYYNDVDVILDVGGQDIKVIFLSAGEVQDFRLNTQCSAGNGFYLQNAALRFGIDVENFASVAATATRIPPFKIGCAVFLEADIVTFQQQGWTIAEILAGLASVLPRNVWEFVVQEPTLSLRGRRFLLQGGTHLNLAVVQAQVDYIQQRVPDAVVHVHPHAAEAGAIGAALVGLHTRRGQTRSFRTAFLGFDALDAIRYEVRRDAATRCNHCSNTCQRTLVTAAHGEVIRSRTILAPCERGSVDNPELVRKSVERNASLDHERPNFVRVHRDQVFEFGLNDNHFARTQPALPWASRLMNFFVAPKRVRTHAIVGLPRTLNLWRFAPFFNTYLRTVLPSDARVIWSKETTGRMIEAGRRFNSTDLCLPGNYSAAHINDLIGRGVKCIINPAMVTLDSSSCGNVGAAACPVAMANPDIVRAAFTTGTDWFQRNGVDYFAPVLHMDNESLMTQELWEFAGAAFGTSRSMHNHAVQQGWAAYRAFYDMLSSAATASLRAITGRNQVAVLFLGHPYHYDSGICHGIPDELQRRGYPVFTTESLPRDRKFLEALFGNDIRNGTLQDPFDIRDVWKHSLSENVSRKIWAAKVAARIPQLAIVDFLSFRCGPDASAMHVVEQIARCSKTPYYAFHDMDENKPTGSISIRLETIDYYLQQYQRALDVTTGRSSSAESNGIRYPEDIVGTETLVGIGAVSNANS